MAPPSRLTPPQERFNARAVTYVVIASACVITAALYGLADIFPAHIGSGYIGLHLLMSGLMFFVWRHQTLTPRQVLYLAITLCLILFPLSALTSNDAQRYLWDGAVFLSGFDPYITAPDNPIVSDLREIWPTPEEHAAYPTLYPPGALSVFAFCAIAGPIYGFWLWKVILTLTVIASLFLAYDLLRHNKKLHHFCLIGLNPLLLFEMGAGAHLDVFCVLGIITAIWCVQKDKILLAGVIIGVAATFKFLPAVIAGPFLFYLKPKKAVKLLLSSSLTWISIYLLMIGLGYKPLGLLPTFFEKWRGGAPFYPVLEIFQSKTGLSNSQFLFLLSALAIAGFSMSAWLARKGNIYIAIIIALAVPLILSPVLFPWYLMSLVPLLALRPNLTLIAAVTLTPFSYIVLNKWLSQNIWEPALWPSVVLAVGIIMAMSLDFRAKHALKTPSRQF